MLTMAAVIAMVTYTIVKMLNMITTVAMVTAVDMVTMVRIPSTVA